MTCTSAREASVRVSGNMRGEGGSGSMASMKKGIAAPEASAAVATLTGAVLEEAAEAPSTLAILLAEVVAATAAAVGGGEEEGVSPQCAIIAERSTQEKVFRSG